MTRDPLDLLRVANPVLQPVSYADDDVTRRVAEILDNDGQLIAIVADPPAPNRKRHQWLAAGIAAAAVLVLAVVSAVVFTRGHVRNSVAGTSSVTCAVSTSGGSQAVGARLKQAEVVIGDRVRQLGGSAHSFDLDSGNGRIGFTPRGVSVGKAAEACRATTIAVRPVVARPVAVDRTAPRSPHPLSGLTFAVPSTDAAYARLTATQRAQLTVAMSHYDCTHPTAVTAAGLACSAPSGSTQVLLLAPAVVTGADVAEAEAVGPAVAARSGQWVVAMSLHASGSARLQAFTEAHHTASGITTVSTCGAAGTTPCADFLAFTRDGTVDAVPFVQTALSAVQIAGDYNQATSQALAADYTAASIQLHPR